MKKFLIEYNILVGVAVWAILSYINDSLGQPVNNFFCFLLGLATYYWLKEEKKKEDA